MMSNYFMWFETRISNGTGQSCLAGQRDRSFFIVLGQRGNGRRSKKIYGTGQDGNLTFRHGTGAEFWHFARGQAVMGFWQPVPSQNILGHLWDRRKKRVKNYNFRLILDWKSNLKLTLLKQLNTNSKMFWPYFGLFPSIRNWVLCSGMLLYLHHI